MRRLGTFLWHWRWLLAVGAVLGGCTFGFLQWRAGHNRIDALLAQAEQALAERDYDSARTHFTAYLAARPHDARGHLLAARTARRMRLYDEAGELLQRCRQDGGDAEGIEMESALIALQRGNTTPIPMLRERVANRDDELSLAILEVLIQHDLDTYQLRAAQQGFNVYLARRPADLYALLGRGLLWERFLSFADAVTDYRKAVAAHPENEPARRRLAAALLLVGTPTDALEQYRWLAERAPDDPEVRLGLAKCYRQLGKFDAALPLLEKLVAMEKPHPEALLERGQLEMDRERPADAEKWLRMAERAAPHDRRMVFGLFRCLQALGRTADAEATNARVAAIDNDLRRLDEIRQQVMSKPNDITLRCEGAKIFLRNGERDEGVRWLRAAFQADPTSAQVRQALADAGLSLNK